MILRIAPLALVCLTAMGCRTANDESKRLAIGPTDIALIDSTDLSGRIVSLSGFVSTPYRGGYLVLDDGTGRIPVILPESLGLEVGWRLLVQGLVAELEGYPAIMADEWLYDSLGTSVRSRGTENHSATSP